MKKYPYNVLLSVVLLFVLAGCSSFAVHKDTFRYIPRHERQSKLKRISNWQINGMLSATYSDKKRDTASFEWMQNLDNYKLKITAPLNMGYISIIGNKNGLEFNDSKNNRCLRSRSAEELLYNYFGWKFPVSCVKYWILNIPYPHSRIHDKQFDQYGHLVAFRQHNWKVSYTEFHQVKQVDLPTVITLANKNFFVKLKIKKIAI